MPGRLTLDTASPEDIPSIFAMCKDLIDTYEDTENIDYDKVISWTMHKLIRLLPEYTCVYSGGEKAGFFRFVKEDGQWELDDLFVLPAFRGQGIGTEVIRTCLEKADAPVELCVFCKNTGAVRLYRRMGFCKDRDVSDTRMQMRYKG